MGEWLVHAVLDKTISRYVRELPARRSTEYPLRIAPYKNEVGQPCLSHAAAKALLTSCGFLLYRHATE
jgi:hypothetical protein